MTGFLTRTLLFLYLFAAPLHAKVTRIDVQSRADIAGGKEFGLAGPYEKLAGKIYFAIDPANPSNRIITDIGKAPGNAAGHVEFSSDFLMLKPKRMEKGNGTVLYEVSNRGGKGMLGFFNRAAGSLNPGSEAETGDGFLMHEGFTLLWLGWQFDPPEREGLMRVYAPVASDGGKPITGIVRSDFIVSRKTWDHSLADREHIPYPVADPDDPFHSMTVRDTVEGERRPVPRQQWKFARRDGDNTVPDPGRVFLETGFEPHKIYEVVYRAQNPPVVGVGLAAVRDTISLLKYGSSTELSMTAGAIAKAIGFGISQSGRFLRTWLYQGFNMDESHRKVFDGVMAHVAGAGRGSFNHRFAQPSRDGHPFINFFHPTDIFPFTDERQIDPETGLEDGLLTHSGNPAFLPKIYYTNASYEYWGRAASLIHTSVDGRMDAPMMDNVRIYFFSGGQHGPASFPPRRGTGQQPGNPNDYRWFMRSLLLSMNRWITHGTAPPPSRYPLIGDKTLVLPGQVAFPSIPGVAFPGNFHKAYRADYGPDFRTKGLVTIEPPKLGAAFPIMVPQVNSDGNEIAGLKMPEVQVPLATYTGWNLFNAQSGPVDVLAGMQGSYIPFPLTGEERLKSGDPRHSVQERYLNRGHYVGLVSAAAADLIEQGYLLPQDMPEILKQAGRHWDHLHAPPKP